VRVTHWTHYISYVTFYMIYHQRYVMYTIYFILYIINILKLFGFNLLSHVGGVEKLSLLKIHYVRKLFSGIQELNKINEHKSDLT
jgi:hypothetical protein